MEYLLRDTDILDEQLGTQFNREVLAKPDCFEMGKTYRLEVSFNVNLLQDKRFEMFNVPTPSKTNKGKPEDIIYDVLGYQLHVLEQRLAGSGVEVHSATIKGEKLEEERIVKIEIIEEDLVPNTNSKGKKKKQNTRLKVFNIMPNRPYISDIASEMAGKALGKIYWDIMSIVKDKKRMSAVLGIEETEDHEILTKAFLEQYRGLWLATGERGTELVDRLEARILNVMFPK